MAKLSTLTQVRPQPLIQTSQRPDTFTGNLAPAYTRDAKGELFLFAISNMVGEDTFYEAAPARDERFRNLVAQVTREDPSWIARFVPYLRNQMFMRSASIVMAVEYVIAGGPHGRAVIDSAIARADEPGEVLGYYRSRVGRSVPQPIKRGIADAVERLYNERNVIRYKERGGYSMADVVRIAHPKPVAAWQNELFRYLTRNEQYTVELPEGREVLPTLNRYLDLMNMPIEARRAVLQSPERLYEAGMTWESVAGWLQGPMDKEAWEALIPEMGYMALLRNLRNFEDAGISEASKAKVIARLTDPEEVARSKQFPIRFYSAYKNVRGFGFLDSLEKALDLTVQNVPELKGNTLIMVDNSGSMSARMSGKSTVTMREIAGLFGAALAKRAEKFDLIPYADRPLGKVTWTGPAPVLKIAQEVTKHGGGTRTLDVLQKTFANHDRVVILTDEQTSYGPSPDNIKAPIYTFNLAGYSAAQFKSGYDRVTLGGGLTDAAFRVIPLIESGKKQDWPF